MLGKRTEMTPYGAAPNYPPITAQQAAQAAVASMTAKQTISGNLSDFYSEGHQMYHELQSDTIYNCLTDMQKGALMIFLRATLWADVPKIWLEIEAAKTESDLPTMCPQQEVEGKPKKPECLILRNIFATIPHLCNQESGIHGVGEGNVPYVVIGTTLASTYAKIRAPH